MARRGTAKLAATKGRFWVYETDVCVHGPMRSAP